MTGVVTYAAPLTGRVYCGKLYHGVPCHKPANHEGACEVLVRVEQVDFGGVRVDVGEVFTVSWWEQ